MGAASPRLPASSHDHLRCAVHHRAPACGHISFKTMTLFFFLFGLFVLWFFNAEFERERNNRRLARMAEKVSFILLQYRYAFDVSCEAQVEQEAIQ